MIKFRGKRLSDGQTIYGYYHERGGDAYIDDWRVDRDTVRQLCVIDYVRGELYEGDEYLDAQSNKCTVVAAPAVIDNLTGEIKMPFVKQGCDYEGD